MFSTVKCGSPEVSCSSPAAPDNVTAVDGNRRWRYRTVSEPFSARLHNAAIRLPGTAKRENLSDL